MSAYGYVLQSIPVMAKSLHADVRVLRIFGQGKLQH